MAGTRLNCLALMVCFVQLSTAKELEQFSQNDWSSGASAWQSAMGKYEAESDLWTQPNFCDAKVLHGSAPLTVLFGLSTFWDEVKARRDSLEPSGAAETSKPLEIHIPGAAYPFEGRSDWSLLADHRPPDVPKVRVVLVLGTPWHEDNVPVMDGAREHDEVDKTNLLQFGVSIRKPKPEVGSVGSEGQLQCRKKSTLAKGDEDFRKADLCRDHGNGLEVVCVEKYYQEAAAELPKPDLVVMFSPGFPQLARRSWDKPLRALMDSDVPIMVNDLLPDTDSKIYDVTGKSLPQPGKEWTFDRKTGEGGMTLTAMEAYDAKRVGGWRNPFPIYIPQDDVVIAKNIMVQLYRGRNPGARPWVMPSRDALKRRKRLLNLVKFTDFLDKDNAKEVKKSLLTPTSTAYDKAMWIFYRDTVKKQVMDKRAKDSKKYRNRLRKEWKPIVEKLWRRKRDTPWTLDEWTFILAQLKFTEF